MNRQISVKKLTKAAILTALAIVLTRFFSFVIAGNLRIGIGTLPIMLSGIYLGPVLGILTGISSDLIGIVINAQGTPHLGFTLSSALAGALPGMVFLLIKGNAREKSTLKVLLSVLLVYGFVHLGLNSLWLSGLMKTTYSFQIVTRALKVAIESAIAFILLKIIIEKLSEVFEK